MRCLPAALLLALLLCVQSAQAETIAPISDEAQRLYQTHGDAVYQVQVIDIASDKKTSIGSGFQFTADGLIATNYHVVAEAVQRGGNNRIEYLHDRGEKGALTVIAADVTHDLAIVKMDRPGKTFLNLGTSKLPKGVKLFSLGNPHDIGFTIIEGTYNGLSKDSFVEKIHFSGSINPGMSGGPAITHAGDVAGINVATAGNQISFLVPVEPLRNLSQKAASGKTGNFMGAADKNIEKQLLDMQEKNVSDLLKKDWESVPFGPVMVPGRTHEALKCWGGVNHKEKDPYQFFFSVCASQDRVFLDEDFDTGSILYRYDYITAKDNLDLSRFYDFYEQQYMEPASDYQNVKEGDAGNFDCNSRFVDLAGLRWKSSLCVRQYKKYPALYDMHLAMAMVGEGKKGLIATLAAQGVSQKSALALAERFMSEIKAPSGDKKRGGKP